MYLAISTFHLNMHYEYLQTISVNVLIKNNKKRSCVVDVFPSKQAMLCLIGAICLSPK